MNSYEKFYDNVKVLKGSNSFVHYVSIPKKLIQGLGIKKGDQIRILISKQEQTNEIES